MTEQTNRCVITGLGLVCAIGNSVDEAWDHAVRSFSGIQHTQSLDTEGCYADLAAEVHCPDLDDIPGNEDYDRSVLLSIKAAREAMQDADLSDFAGDPRACVIMGSCVGGAVSISDYYKKGKDPAYITKMPISPIAPQTAAYFHAGGVVTNIANACAAGTISIAYACELIRAGKADVVLAGGSDTFADVPYSGFLSLHALDADGCSPFNRMSGITLGEGAGVLVVESYEHAMARGARIYCEVLGAGVSSDAHHITAPREDGEGQMEAINRAIRNSGIDKSDIGYVNAHGTGTGLNDSAEFLSLHTIFDTAGDADAHLHGASSGAAGSAAMAGHIPEKNENNLSVSSTKAMTGHCLGAAGAIEAVFSVKALTTATVPATLGFADDDMALLKERAGNMDFVPNHAHAKDLTHVMSNSFAFGGNNASIIFSSEPGDVHVREENRPVAITGIGSVLPEVTEDGPAHRCALEKADFDDLDLKMSFYRKLDNFSKLQAVSGVRALKNGCFEVTDDNAADIGIIVGTSEGALGTCCEFQEHITSRGNAAGSAFKFPNTVYNAAGGYLSICSGIKGYNVTVTNGAQSGLASSAYAMTVIRSGQEKAMIATGTDENSDIMEELFAGLGLSSDTYVRPYSGGAGFTLTEGSVSLLLEDADAAGQRGAHIYCLIEGYGMAHSPVPFGTLSGSEEGLKRAIANALSDAHITADDIDAVYGFANGISAVDVLEVSVYREVFGERMKDIPVISVKDRYGEGRAASAALAEAVAAIALAGGYSAPAYIQAGTADEARSVSAETHDIAAVEARDKAADEAHTAAVEARAVVDAYRIGSAGDITKIQTDTSSWRHVLVTSYASGGSYTALVLSKYMKDQAQTDLR